MKLVLLAILSVVIAVPFGRAADAFVIAVCVLLWYATAKTFRAIHRRRSCYFGKAY